MTDEEIEAVARAINPFAFKYLDEGWISRNGQSVGYLCLEAKKAAKRAIEKLDAIRSSAKV